MTGTPEAPPRVAKIKIAVAKLFCSFSVTISLTFFVINFIFCRTPSSCDSAFYSEKYFYIISLFTGKSLISILLSLQRMKHVLYPKFSSHLTICSSPSLQHFKQLPERNYLMILKICPFYVLSSKKNSQKIVTIGIGSCFIKIVISFKANACPKN